MVQKTKITASEDAEIITSDVPKSEIKDKPKKSNRFKFFVILGLIINCLALFFLFSIFPDRENIYINRITNLENGLKSLTPIVSLVDIQKKINNLEIKSKKENFDYFNKELNQLEMKILTKIDSLDPVTDPSEIDYLLEDYITELELRLRKKFKSFEVLSKNYDSDLETKKEKTEEIFVKIEDLEDKLSEKTSILSESMEELKEEILKLEIKYKHVNSLDTRSFNSIDMLTLQSFDNLKLEFSKLSYEALKAEIFLNANDNMFSYWIASIKAVFVFRSIKPNAGTDTDAVLSRAADKLSLGDLDGCLEQLEQLNTNAAKIFYEWKKQAILIRYDSN